MLAITNNIPVKDKMEADLEIKVSLMKEVIKPTRPHRHANYHELILLNQGSGFHEIDGHQFEVISPVAYYLRPGQTHCWNFSSLPKGFVILFREELLLKEDIEILFRFPAQIALSAADHPLFDLVNLLYNEFKSAAPDTGTYRAYLHLLIAKLRQLSKTGKPIFNGADHLFQQYKRLVNDHFAQTRELGFYAERLHVTTAVLNETCKKAVYKTPAVVINERILLEAKLLLSATGKSVHEIATDLGFTDSPHFIKFFKQNTNLTPGAYREMAVTKG
ncbi:AraC family transcriptional regulator [Mucilaginibacter sp. KACC 22063]|uniref:AraC family transcriptional regulator n=1 Tax=Mucilaginibacter sp. KACC 22063 TaxID=3025666 RepID=UPI0023656EB0|nr:helix-turn-helix domain-containing protein [Mucilaginibacter sp. KACC 22063]WDF54208.1 helix-turn-helix transcriptional regulator [Mucilaginibacter sp. KACC 22063]